VWLGRVRRALVYRFWTYASDAMTAGVAIARRGRWGGGQYRFPLWLSKMSRTRSRRQTTQSLCRKIGGGIHASWRRTALDVLPSFKEVFRADKEFRGAMAATFRFDEKELALLLDADEDAREVRELAAMGGEAPKARGGLSAFEGDEA
jgi:replication factor C large subunit